MTCTWYNRSLCLGKEREQDLCPDLVEPLPEDQREAGRRQLHSGAQHQTQGKPGRMEIFFSRNSELIGTFLSIYLSI